jgi:hypothetical protein
MKRDGKGQTIIVSGERFVFTSSVLRVPLLIRYFQWCRENRIGN